MQFQSLLDILLSLQVLLNLNKALYFLQYQILQCIAKQGR